MLILDRDESGNYFNDSTIADNVEHSCNASIGPVQVTTPKLFEGSVLIQVTSQLLVKTFVLSPPYLMINVHVANYEGIITCMFPLTCL